MLILYFVLSSLLLSYSFHRFYIIFLYIHNYKNKPKLIYNSLKEVDLPIVTVQVPIYNEPYVATRILEAVCKLQYPSHKLQIQILDDSTDITQDIIQKDVLRLSKEYSVNIQYLHRNNREAFKAGALKEGLKQAKGSLVAIFDADFIPEADFLLKTVPYFQEERVGVVQTKWSYVNSNYSLLTKFQQLQLDAHFQLEHTARFSSGYFINFNGTAGILRKQAIIDAGNWSFRTLTEDLDLSYKMQLLHYKIIYLPNIECKSELPEDIISFKRQQFRWTKGTVQTAIRHFKPILLAKIDWKVRLEAFIHLLAPMSYLFSLILSLITPFVWIENTSLQSSIFIFEVITTIFMLSSFIIYLYYAQKQISVDWYKSLRSVFLFILIGLSLVISNTIAVLEALFQKYSSFERTPKESTLQNKKDSFQKYKKYFRENTLISILEIFYFIFLNIGFISVVMKAEWYKIPLFLFFLLASYYNLFLYFEKALVKRH